LLAANELDVIQYAAPMRRATMPAAFTAGIRINPAVATTSPSHCRALLLLNCKTLRSNMPKHRIRQPLPRQRLRRQIEL
jgi:hypothetical protein